MTSDPRLRPDAARSAGPRRRQLDQHGVTLIELLIVVAVMAVVVLPVLMWMVTAMKRSTDHRVTDRTVAVALLNRYVKADVAASLPYSKNPERPAGNDGGPIENYGCTPAPSGADKEVVLWLLSNEPDPLLTTYVAVSGRADGDGVATSHLVRRQCDWDADTGSGTDVIREQIVSDQLMPSSTTGTFGAKASCAPRAGNEDDEDMCGEVSLTINRDLGLSTIRATRRVDPPLEYDPNRRPVAVIKCDPACPASGTRRFTVAFNSMSSYDPDGINGVEWDFGDGTTSSDRNPVHTYSDLNGALSRTFQVKLTVFNEAGLFSTARTQVTVRNATPVAVANPPSWNGNRIDYVPFDGSASLDPDADPAPGLTYFWEFGDGTTSNEAKPEGGNGHRYQNLGDYTARLTVTDADGVSDTVTIPVSIRNKPPIACFSTQQTSPAAPSPNPGGCINEPNPLTPPNPIRTDTYPITVTFVTNSVPDAESRDLDGSIASRIWYVGTGNNPPTQRGVGPTFTRTFTQGLHTVQLEVVDNDGASSKYAIQIEINERPNAQITYVAPSTSCRYNVRPGGPCYLSGSTSFDPDGSIVSYAWDFGDGTTATGPEVSHTWTEYGTYDVTLTVTDDVGSVSTAQLVPKAKVNEAPTPVIGPSGAWNVYRKLPFAFNSSGSFDDPTGTIVSYLWNFGDGNTSTAPNPTYSYLTLGPKTVSLRVCDEDNLCTTTSKSLVVLNQAPVAVITGHTGGNIQGLTANLSGTTSYDPDASIVSYFWEMGDGTTYTTPTVNHTYANYGARTIRLTVTDTDGATNTATLAAYVNRLPTANFTSNYPFSHFIVNPPLDLRFNASSSSDPDGSIVEYRWDLGAIADPVFTSNSILDQRYDKRGRWSVTLTVVDDRGGTASITREVLIIDQKPIPVMTMTPVNGVVSDPPWTVGFSSAGSSDPDGTITGYLWDFGDGTTSTSPNPSHAFPSSPFRSYVVRLTVTDNWGVSDFIERNVKVNAPPTAVIAGPNPLSAGRNLPFALSSAGSTDPDGTIASYLWNFGDGTTSTLANPTKTWATINTFTITLTVTDNDGKSTTVTKLVNTNNAPPIARYTQNGLATSPLRSSNTPPPFTVNFDGSTSTDQDDPSPTAIATYTWEFGDGSPAVSGPSATTSHTYLDYGTYTTRLTVTDQGGATATTTKVVKVNRSPVVSFTPDFPQVVGTAAPFTVNFNASASSDPDGTIASYQWNVGPGARTGVAPSFTYNGPGTWTVTLTVTDNDGGVTTLTKTDLIRVNRAPTAVISTPTPSQFIDNTEPFTYLFTSGSTDLDGTIASVLWDFGDGTTSTDPTPNLPHTYASSGNYTVRLTVTDNNGGTGTTTVVLRANAAPTAVIGPSVLDPKRNLPFTFDGTGSTDPDGGSITAYSWTFGGGGVPATSSASKPAVTFPSNATGVSVTLTVTDNNLRTHTVTRTFDVVDNVAPTASFTTNPSPASGYTPTLPVAVDGSASADPDGTIVNWAWNWGDGSPVTNTATPTSSHDYTAYGNFTLTLTVTDNSGGTATFSRPVRHNRPPTVVIATLPSPPRLSPIAGSTPGADPEAWRVFFDATGSADADGTIVSYAWDFADGTTATGVSATHTFTARGTYDVTLTVTDNEGGITVQTVPVKVNRLPTATITPPVNPQRLAPASFSGLGSLDPDGSVVSWAWDFGDGRTGSGPLIDHTFVTVGTFTVTLTVTDDDGGIGVSTATVIVANQVPTAEIVMSPDPAIGAPPLAVTVDGGASFDPDGTLVSYEWDYGDGTQATGITPPVHNYTAYGTFTLTLTVTDNNGDQSIATKSVKVNRAPEPTITVGSVLRGIAATFTGGGSDPDGTIVSWRWDFNDGPAAVSNVKNPTYTYQTYGTKVVSLTATDNDGRTATVTRTITVGNQQPTAAISATSNTPNPTQLRGGNPLTINFNGGGSADPDNTLDAAPGTVIATYAWDFGDGSPVVSGPSPTVSHTYTATGTRTARLTVTDSDGGTGTTTVTVTVQGNVAPTASFTRSPGSGFAPLTVFFDASASSDSDGVITSYEWTFGDGTTATGPTVSHTYTAGQWTATLTVRDNGNLTGTSSQLVAVGGQLPYPTGLRVVSAGVFAWDAVPGATRYTIQAIDRGWNSVAGWICGGEDYTASVNVPNTQVNLGYCTGRDYDVSIQTWNGAQPGPQSPAMRVGF